MIMFKEKFPFSFIFLCLETFSHKAAGENRFIISIKTQSLFALPKGLWFIFCFHKLIKGVYKV